MPRFYFHLVQGNDVLIDPEGVELTDLAAVRAKALAVARDLIGADATTGVVDLGIMLRIVDAKEHLVLELAFCDAVAFHPTPQIKPGPS